MLKKTLGVFSCVMVLLAQGCAAKRDFVYTDKPAQELKDKPAAGEILREKEFSKDWVDSFTEEKGLSRECPVCQRRYYSYQERCPYDETELIDR